MMLCVRRVQNCCLKNSALPLDYKKHTCFTGNTPRIRPPRHSLDLSSHHRITSASTNVSPKLQCTWTACPILDLDPGPFSYTTLSLFITTLCGTHITMSNILHVQIECEDHFFPPPFASISRWKWFAFTVRVVSIVTYPYVLPIFILLIQTL